MVERDRNSVIEWRETYKYIDKETETETERERERQRERGKRETERQ